MTKESYPMQINPSINPENGTSYAENERKSKHRKKKCIIISLITLLALIIFIIVVVKLVPADDTSNSSSGSRETADSPTTADILSKIPWDEKMGVPANTSKIILKPPNPVERQPASYSQLHIFNGGAAVCSDSESCSIIGRDILKQGGNAIDATIATMLCTGVTVMQSMGIGGGFIMNYYNRNDNKAYTLDAREVAPMAATKDMFVNDTKKSLVGPLAIAVPGEVAGYVEAWRRFGSLEWKDLVDPAVQICDDGFYMSRHMEDAISFVPALKEDANLKQWFWNKSSNDYYKADSLITPYNLCDTLKSLSENGGEDFYNGTISEMVLKDLQEMGSIITAEDLLNYKPKWYDSVPVDIFNNTLHVVPPPGNGLIIAFIMNILKGYNITEKVLDKGKEEILFHHRLIEAFKFAYSQRAQLGDPQFVNVTEVENRLKDPAFAEEIRKRIRDDKTSNDPAFYDAKHLSKNNRGTSPMTVIAPNGDAVAVTSTVNFYFGSVRTGPKSGIIFNNAMNDFSTPDQENIYGFKESPTNYIVPQKRPLSSMSPTIVTDTAGNVTLVVSAAGGSKIPSAISSALINVLWFHKDIKHAVDDPRVHHQLAPNKIQYEYGVLDQIVSGLENLGHQTERYRERGSVLCAIYQNSTGIFANADYRKRGDVQGL